MEGSGHVRRQASGGPPHSRGALRAGLENPHATAIHERHSFVKGAPSPLALFLVHPPVIINCTCGEDRATQECAPSASQVQGQGRPCLQMGALFLILPLDQSVKLTLILAALRQHPLIHAPVRELLIRPAIHTCCRPWARHTISSGAGGSLTMRSDAVV